MIGNLLSYSALPRRFSSKRCSIFSIAARSFKSCDLFSDTSSAKERFLGFLIGITILKLLFPFDITYCNSYYARKRLQLLQLFENFKKSESARLGAYGLERSN